MFPVLISVLIVLSMPLAMVEATVGTGGTGANEGTREGESTQLGQERTSVVTGNQRV